MKAMLYADWLNFRQSIRSMLFIIVVFAFTAFAWNRPMFFIMVVVMLSILTPATLCASDEAYGWNKLSLSLPILRREVVGGKFLMGLMINLLLFVLAAVMTVICSLVDPSTVLIENIASLCAGEWIALLLMGLMFAITFKFGVEKSRYILIAVVWVPILTLAAIVKFGIAPGVVEEFRQGLERFETAPIGLPMAAALLICFAAYGVFYTISVRTFQKKEL